MERIESESGLLLIYNENSNTNKLNNDKGFEGSVHYHLETFMKACYMILTHIICKRLWIHFMKWLQNLNRSSEFLLCSRGIPYLYRVSGEISFSFVGPKRACVPCLREQTNRRTGKQANRL